MSRILDKTVEFPSEMKNMIMVDNLVHEVCARHKIDEDKYGDILISVNDAVKNAIEHGNQNDPSKTVSISVHDEPHHVIFSIKDQGSGFEHGHIPGSNITRKRRKNYWSRALFDQKLNGSNGF